MKATLTRPRTARSATLSDVLMARRALSDLEKEFLSVILVPAPQPHFDGHMIRVAQNRNPKWYRDFVEGHWDTRGCQIKKKRVIRGLHRVLEKRTILKNGYEWRLLEHLKKYYDRA